MNSIIKFTFVSFLVICVPLIVSVFVATPYFLFSIYGICIALYSSIQMIFAYANRRTVEKLTERSKPTDLMYNILVVGYREDKELFRKCLESMKYYLYNLKISKIIVVIDGDTEDDKYMVDIFNEVFIIDSKTIHGNLYTIPMERAICISQPHKGKRSVLYTGFKLSELMCVEGVICTDSDTIFCDDTVSNLVKLAECSDNVGAVTGSVEIVNKTNFISFMTHLRYWFACNIERAYQSYNGCVMCVSGPIGLYKMKYLRLFLDKWYNQQFLGEECTYGDDRHLTNNILLLGKKVLYTHLARCYTDAPDTIYRFFTQQVRWCKSSYREILWTMKCLDKHSVFMTVDIIYQTMYGIIVFAGVVYIVSSGTVLQVLVYFFLISIFNNLKGLYALAIERDTKFLAYGLYGMIYLSILVPARLYAGFTLKDISWGTSSRNIIKNDISVGHLCMYTWNFLLISGIVTNFVMNHGMWGIVEVSMLCLQAVYIFGQMVILKRNI